ncbi:hypothetical protein EVAR_12051_1 [Eumeta japonica]|uniref:Reverse transcriptase domain-containing protein n=1 Tax=Eumeta variegata TaxID=151549 RepID=A0A4C1U5B7_EUMVA|nr:hypothetical protein EVAR_12051_1 [Eumeta japonica]
MKSVKALSVGLVLGPVLYNIFILDFPISNNVTVATYADDIAYLPLSKDSLVAKKRILSSQNGVLRAIVDAPWFTKSNETHEYLNMPTLYEIQRHRGIMNRLMRHPKPTCS